MGGRIYRGALETLGGGPTISSMLGRLRVFGLGTVGESERWAVCLLSVLFILLHRARRAMAASVMLLQMTFSCPRRGFCHSRAPLSPPPNTAEGWAVGVATIAGGGGLGLRFWKWLRGKVYFSLFLDCYSVFVGRHGRSLDAKPLSRL